MCDSSAAAISVSTGWPAKSSFASAFWPERERRDPRAQVPQVVQHARDVGPAVLEPRRPARDRLEREQPVVVRLVDLERDVRVVGAQPVEHRDERVVELVHVAHAVGAAEAVEPHQEVELEVAHVPALDRLADAALDVRQRGRSPRPEARLVRAARPGRPGSRHERVADRVAHPLRMLRAKVSDDGLKNVGLIHRPSFIGAIASRTAPKCASGNRGLNFESGLPSQRGSGYSGESGCQSPERACQPSSRMNVSTPIRRAIGAISCTVAKSMSSFAPVEMRFESTPLELNVTACSYGSSRWSTRYRWNCHGSSASSTPKPVKTAGSANGSPGRTTRTRAWPSHGFSTWACSSNGPRLSTSREKSTTALPATPSYATREEGRSLRSITMNALRSPSRERDPLAAARQRLPGPAVRVSRHVPGCGSPIVNGGPVQSGSRQSAPARKEWIVGVDRRRRHRLVQASPSTARAAPRTRSRSACESPPRPDTPPRCASPSRPAAARRRQPHRHAQAAARELRDAHRLDRERLAPQLAARPATARSRATRVLHSRSAAAAVDQRCGAERRPRPAARWPARCSARSSVAPTVGLHRPVAVGLARAPRARAKRPATAASRTSRLKG